VLLLAEASEPLLSGLTVYGPLGIGVGGLAWAFWKMLERHSNQSDKVIEYERARAAKSDQRADEAEARLREVMTLLQERALSAILEFNHLQAHTVEKMQDK